MKKPPLEIPEQLRGKQNLPIKQTGVILGLGRSKVYELITSGRLRSLKIDGARRVPVAAIEDFLAAQDGA